MPWRRTKSDRRPVHNYHGTCQASFDTNSPSVVFVLPWFQTAAASLKSKTNSLYINASLENAGRGYDLVQRRCYPGIFNKWLSRHLCRLYCPGVLACFVTSMMDCNCSSVSLWHQVGRNAGPPRLIHDQRSLMSDPLSYWQLLKLAMQLAGAWQIALPDTHPCPVRYMPATVWEIRGVVKN